MSTVTKEQMAALLNGREYGHEITPEERRLAESSGIVVVFGYSDDNMEMRGAWDDERGCHGSKTWRIGPNGIHPKYEDIDHEDVDEAREWFKNDALATKKLTAHWSPKSPACSWIYEVDVPFATFDIMECGELYCRGIVFAVADLKEDAK